MTRLFDIVRARSGQSASISIPRPYIKLFEGNYTHAAVLSEIENIARTHPSGVLFPLPHEELANWLFLTIDQVRYSVRIIKKGTGGAVHTQVKKYNGTPTTHYYVDLSFLNKIKEVSCQ